ncbi:MAG: Stealth CR1 domain-containing protein [Clostridia bacterium]|nr:Stealth CR1 domain-containing protein [Clostridia bacterium]
MDKKIDFVLIWVDGGDVNWQKERNRYAGKDPEDLADYRFRDWENLKYWFRGVEKFAPWVNNIYFITCGHYPEWLNLKHPKLKFIKHEDYIPKEYLPTFSANPIELNFHRIKDLEEQFVFFNDDTFLIDHVKKEDFFEKGLPKYIAALDIPMNGDATFEHILLNDIQIINKYFKKQNVIKNNFKKWFCISYGTNLLIKNCLLLPFKHFSSFKNLHMPTPILKSTMNELWKKEYEKLNRTSMNKFRTSEDINQYVFAWFDIAKGNFKPAKRKNGEYFQIKKDNEDMLNCIKNNSKKMICLNDTSEEFDFERAKKEIINAFEIILPDKSKFEL